MGGLSMLKSFQIGILQKNRWSLALHSGSNACQKNADFCDAPFEMGSNRQAAPLIARNRRGLTLAHPVFLRRGQTMRDRASDEPSFGMDAQGLTLKRDTAMQQSKSDVVVNGRAENGPSFAGRCNDWLMICRCELEFKCRIRDKCSKEKALSWQAGRAPGSIR